MAGLITENTMNEVPLRAILPADDARGAAANRRDGRLPFRVESEVRATSNNYAREVRVWVRDASDEGRPR